MKRTLFEIWIDDHQASKGFPWRAQMVNYVAGFPTRDDAERYVASIQAARAQEAKAVK